MTGPPDPVGYQGEVRFVGRQHRHALASPSCEIGDHHVGFEVQLRLIEEEPAAGCSSTPTKRRDQLAAKGGCRKGVGLGAPRADAENAVDELRYLVGWRVEDVLVRGMPCCAIHHVTIFVAGVRPGRAAWSCGRPARMREAHPRRLCR